MIISLNSRSELARFLALSKTSPVSVRILPDERFIELFLIASATSAKLSPNFLSDSSDTSMVTSSRLVPNKPTIDT